MFGYSMAEIGNIFVMQGFSGLSLFSVLLLMALGLAIIFGQMGVINMAHGEMMMLGAYTTYNPARDITYLRFAYVCRVTGFEPNTRLDHGIVRAVWMTPDEVAASPIRHRSPLVMRCIHDYLSGRRFPLDFVTHS